MHTIHLPDWAVERGRLLNHFRRIEPDRAALLAIDMQNAFMRPGDVFANPHACDIVPNINGLAAAVRASGGAVIWTRQTISPHAPFAYPDWQFDRSVPRVREAMDALSDGAHGHDLHQDMDVHSTDLVLNKYRYSAFWPHPSQLGAELQARAIDTLIITGTLTNCCCESTARDANMLGYKVLFVSDATAAVTDDEHNAALLNLRIMFADVRSTAEMSALIADSARKA